MITTMTMPTILRTLLVLCVVAGTASAQQQKPAVEQARAKYKEAETLFHVGKYSEAVALYKEAYELSTAPGLLFNIAQAYRLGKDYEQAVRFYETFLRLSPNPPNQVDVERWIAESKAALAKKQREDRRKQEEERRKAEEEQRRLDEEKQALNGTTGSNQPPVGDSNLVVSSEGTGETPSGWSSLKTAGLFSGGLGVVLLGTSGFMAVRANSAWSDINTLSDDRGTWSTEHQNQYDNAERDETISTALLVGGSIGVSAGVLLFVLGMQDSGEKEKLTIRPELGGASLVLNW